MEATRVDGDCHGILTDRCFPAELLLELLVSIVPDHDILIRARDDELLAQASVHTVDWLVMERSMHIFTRC